MSSSLILILKEILTTKRTYSEIDPDNSMHYNQLFFSFLKTAAKMIKETMDKKFGASWHAVVGEGFGMEITHECRNLLYMFFGGNMAVCVWKCS